MSELLNALRRVAAIAGNESYHCKSRGNGKKKNLAIYNECVCALTSLREEDENMRGD